MSFSWSNVVTEYLLRAFEKLHQTTNHWHVTVTGHKTFPSFLVVAKLCGFNLKLIWYSKF